MYIYIQKQKNISNPTALKWSSVVNKKSASKSVMTNEENKTDNDFAHTLPEATKLTSDAFNVFLPRFGSPVLASHCFSDIINISANEMIKKHC